MSKNEFPVKFNKDINSAWCGSAYFTNSVLGKKYCVTVAAAPREKKTIASPLIRDRLTAYEKEMRNRHPNWTRVSEEDYDKFRTIR